MITVKLVYMYNDDEQAMRGGELSTRGARDVSHDPHKPSGPRGGWPTHNANK
jgi:hypothetical protein